MKPDRAVSRMDGAGTDQDAEVQLYLAAKRARVSRRRLAAQLGWTPEKLDVVRRRATRIIARDPLRRQRSIAGTQFYKLDSLFFPPLASDLTGTSVSGWRLESVENDLLNSLSEARLKLDRLTIEGRAAHDRVEEAEARLSQLRTDAAHDAEMALIEDRPADSKLPKTVSATEAELKTAQQSAKAHAGAVQKQQAIVGKIEDQIAARRYEIFSKAVEAPQKRLDKAVIELLSAAVDVADVAALHGYQATHLLVSRGELNDEVLGRLVDVVRTALQAAYFWENAYSGNAPEFHKANHQGPFIITQRAIPVHPIQARINDERERLRILVEEYSVLHAEYYSADRKADGLRYKERSLEGGWIPLAASDKPEYERLKSVAEAKQTELKENEADRKKLIEEVIPALEKELQAVKRAAAA